MQPVSLSDSLATSARCGLLGTAYLATSGPVMTPITYAAYTTPSYAFVPRLTLALVSSSPLLNCAVPAPGTIISTRLPRTSSSFKLLYFQTHHRRRRTVVVAHATYGGACPLFPVWPFFIRLYATRAQ